jgi:sirohydrochlorin ferrochelatase
MSQTLAELRIDPLKLGIVIVDHGSRVAESNRLLVDVVELFRQSTGIGNAHPAHMELAPPTIRDAFRACRQDGAEFVAVCPFFLLPGRHWSQDIPQLSRDAAESLGGIPHVVCPPLGLHPLLAQLMQLRIEEGLRSVRGQETSSPSTTGE